MVCWLTTGVVTARCSIIVCITRCGAGVISVVEWTTVSRRGGVLTSTLTHHQTGAITYYIIIVHCAKYIAISSNSYCSHLHVQSVTVSIVKTGLLLSVVQVKQSLLVLMLNTLAGGDWSSSPTVPKFPDVHLNVNCAVNCPLAVFLVYLTATDTCLY